MQTTLMLTFQPGTTQNADSTSEHDSTNEHDRHPCLANGMLRCMRAADLAYHPSYM